MLDPIYDIPVDPNMYPAMGIIKPCFIRTHKQIVVHRTLLSKRLGDIKNNYVDLFLLVLEKRELFSKSISDQALS